MKGVNNLLWNLICDVAAEQGRQISRFGEQNHPIVKTVKDADYVETCLAAARKAYEDAAPGEMDWLYIAEEEFWEIFEAKSPDDRYKEVVQLVAVLATMLESEYRRADQLFADCNSRGAKSKASAT